MIQMTKNVCKVFVTEWTSGLLALLSRGATRTVSRHSGKEGENDREVGTEREEQRGKKERWVPPASPGCLMHGRGQAATWPAMRRSRPSEVAIWPRLQYSLLQKMPKSVIAPSHAPSFPPFLQLRLTLPH